MSKDIWVLAETKDGKVRKITHELLSKASELVTKSGAGVSAILIGHNVASLAQDLAHYGANKVYVADHESLNSYTTDGYTNVIANLLKENQAGTFLTGTTANGKDLTPRVAVRLEAGAVSDATELDCDVEGKMTAVRPIYAGKAFEKVTFSGFPQIIEVRSNSFIVKAADESKTAEIINVTLNLGEVRTKVTATNVSSGDKIELTEADIIVSGGRGLKGPENLYLVSDLAKAMGAAQGASRAIVDAGWIDYDYQVGQTGKVVSPNLYVACGISGAIQHLAGMSSSKIIVAINKDADAPIFKVADYGIVGDVFQILPALTAEVNKTKAN